VNLKAFLHAQLSFPISDALHAMFQLLIFLIPFSQYSCINSPTSLLHQQKYTFPNLLSWYVTSLHYTTVSVHPISLTSLKNWGQAKFKYFYLFSSSEMSFKHKIVMELKRSKADNISRIILIDLSRRL